MGFNHWSGSSIEWVLTIRVVGVDLPVPLLLGQDWPCFLCELPAMEKKRQQWSFRRSRACTQQQHDVCLANKREGDSGRTAAGDQRKELWVEAEEGQETGALLITDAYH